jgi:hypothetical protein
MKPVVKDGILRTENREIVVCSPAFPDCPEWDEWLAGHEQFQFDGAAGRVSGRPPKRNG